MVTLTAFFSLLSGLMRPARCRAQGKHHFQWFLLVRNTEGQLVFLVRPLNVLSGQLALKVCLLPLGMLIWPWTFIMGILHAFFLRLPAIFIKRLLCNRIYIVHTYILISLHNFQSFHFLLFYFLFYHSKIARINLYLGTRIVWLNLLCDVNTLIYIVCLLFYAYSEPFYSSMTISKLASSWKLPQRHYLSLNFNSLPLL